MREMLKKKLSMIKRFLLSGMERDLDRQMIMLGRDLSWRIRDVHELDSLADMEISVHSQFGEDGIIEWLIQKIPISSPRFIEFGVENYREANTRFLLRNRNWKGLVLDCNWNDIEYIRHDELYWRHNLTACHAFINRDNINSLLQDNGFAGKIGILSIDIDGNDYWVWEAIEAVDPDIVIIEYNAVFGDLYPVTIHYNESFQRISAHYSNLYWGAGIKALAELGARKGYALIGSNSNGNNAFFVRRDLFDCIGHLIKNKDARPSMYRESRDADNNLTYIGGLQRFELIKKLPVLRTDTGETVQLESLSQVYSDRWLAQMGYPDGSDVRA